MQETLCSEKKIFPLNWKSSILFTISWVNRYFTGVFSEIEPNKDDNNKITKSIIIFYAGKINKNFHAFIPCKLSLSQILFPFYLFMNIVYDAQVPPLNSVCYTIKTPRKNHRRIEQLNA